MQITWFLKEKKLYCKIIKWKTKNNVTIKKITKQTLYFHFSLKLFKNTRIAKSGVEDSEIIIDATIKLIIWTRISAFRRGKSSILLTLSGKSLSFPEQRKLVDFKLILVKSVYVYTHRYISKFIYLVFIQKSSFLLCFPYAFKHLREITQTSVFKLV